MYVCMHVCMLKSMTFLIPLNLALLPLVHDCFVTEIGSLVMLKELKATHTGIHMYMHTCIEKFYYTGV